MKRKSFKIALCAFCISMIIPTQNVFAKKAVDNDKPIIISRVCKENGRCILWGLCEERYKYVKSYTEYSFVTNPETGEQIKILERVLQCDEPGWSLCRRTANGSKSTYRGIEISDDFLCRIENELLYDIDVEMMVNHNFTGRITRKVLLNEGNNQIVLLFVSQWRDGDSDGNGVIEIKVYDITNQIPTLF